VEDLLHETIGLDDHKIEVEFYYKLNFDADKSCGYIKVFNNTSKREEEKFEVYMELLECGMDSNAVTKKVDSVIADIKSGKLDVTF
jgi:hypothetical protein